MKMTEITTLEEIDEIAGKIGKRAIVGTEISGKYEPKAKTIDSNYISGDILEMRNAIPFYSYFSKNTKNEDPLFYVILDKDKIKEVYILSGALPGKYSLSKSEKSIGIESRLEKIRLEKLVNLTKIIKKYLERRENEIQN